MRPLRWFLVAAPLLAQQQPTFYAAWQDGLEAEQAGRWAEAAAAFRRAILLRPEPAERVVTYGNHLLVGYFPRTHLARCLIELRDLDAAEAELKQAGAEPRAAREALVQRLNDLRPRSSPAAPVRAEPPPVPQPAPATEPPLPSVSTDAPRSVPEPGPSTPSLPASPPHEAPRAEGPGPAPERALPAPPQEPARPLPWTALGLGGAAIAATAWLWMRRRLRNRPAPFASLRHLPADLGPYRLERLLGSGGFADTYFARHRRTGGAVALKVPHPHRAQDPAFRARFHQEAQLGARLDHPNLVRILDPGRPDDPPYLAMEYLPGRTLEARLGDGPLPLAEAVDIALGVAGAMAHAHAHGVVHRDLKPGNVMLAAEGPRVMDLGIARVMDAATVTTTYAFLGTPLYAAPEAQVRTHVGPAADRYSFGVILFHMLAGAPPFEGNTPFQILERHRHAPPPDLAERRPDVPPALARLVARLLDKEPDQRPEDGEILRVLAEVSEGLVPMSDQDPGFFSPPRHQGTKNSFPH
ncbi:serine/threonine-protein kinase [Geothrix sp. 21YS21S-4]|uniref:serine/threonine-protein kinase n=1 Tax=Geothrix sp. 21YS21S-4 TaxID=3068889 RepID=UPI0027BB0A6B|nr:serine/threonine-protein kinase [Geothrix sp. 21YS21S-4]